MLGHGRRPQRRSSTSCSSQLQRFVSGLAEDREAIGASLTNIAELDRVDGRPARGGPARRSRTDISDLGDLSDEPRRPSNDAVVEQFLQQLPGQDRARSPGPPPTARGSTSTSATSPARSCCLTGADPCRLHYETGGREVPADEIPFRERNPVADRRRGLRLVAAGAAAGLQHRRASPSSAAGTGTRPPSARRAGSGPATTCASPASRSARSTASSSTAATSASTSWSTSRRRSGATTGASIRIQTILGKKYLSLEPAGSGQLEPGSEIPLDRTVVGLRRRLGVQRPHRGRPSGSTPTSSPTSLDTLATEFRDTAGGGPRPLDGLSRLSQTIASRDDRARASCSRARHGVTGSWPTATPSWTTLINDGDLLLDELAASAARRSTRCSTPPRAVAAGQRPGARQPRRAQAGAGRAERGAGPAGGATRPTSSRASS